MAVTLSSVLVKSSNMSFCMVCRGAMVVWIVSPVELARPRSLGRRELSGYLVLVVMMSSTTSVLWYYHEAGMASLKHSRVMTRT